MTRALILFAALASWTVFAQEVGPAPEEDAADDARTSEKAKAKANTPAPTAGAHVARPVAPREAVVQEGIWSFGAGLRFGSFGLAGGGVSGSSGSTNAVSVTPLAPQVGFERRIGRRFALILGLAGYYGKSIIEPEDDATPFKQTSQGGGFTVQVGGRVAVTGPQSPVELSAYAAADGGYSAHDVKATLGDGASQTATGGAADLISAGLQLGLIAERELVEGLSVRAATSLVQLRYDDGFVRTSAAGVETRLRTNGLFAGVALSPSLELRLAF